VSYDPLRGTIEEYDKIAKAYADTWFGSHSIDQFLSIFLKQIDVNRPILDAGCGPGREVQYFSSRNLDCVGIDLSAGLINEARNRVPGGVFRLMDIATLITRTHYSAQSSALQCFIISSKRICTPMGAAY
jgi:SAM-dependent methyltransferase